MGDHSRPSAVVVGAGVTGLVAARTMLVAAPSTRVVVVERSARVGGKIATGEFAGRPVDRAADAFLARVPDAVTLCRELGLADQLVTPASRTAYLYTGGELRRFPEGLVLGVPTDFDALARSGTISSAGVARAEQELTLPPDHGDGDGDESVGSLVRRRMGDEVFEVLVAPLLSGVYAGDADRLSARVATPQFVAALREHGSLVAGLRAQLATAAANDAPVFYGLRNGMQTLVDALARDIEQRGGQIVLDTHVEELRRDDADGRWRVVTDADTIDADQLVLATPDATTAALVSPFAPDVADELGAMAYASVVLTLFAVDRDAFSIPLDGTGFLVPEREGLLLTACSWASSKWSHLSGDSVVLRASAGRITDERPSSLPDDELVEALLADLGRTMGLDARPQRAAVVRWPNALPQFEPGHLDRVARWRARLTEVAPGLKVAGAGIEGLGIPACVRQGRVAGEEVAAALV